MKAILLVLALAHCHTHVAAEAGSPINKVIEMLGDLQVKVIKSGEDAQKEYAEFSEFCEDRARQLGHEIKTGKAGVEELTATIEEQKATAAKLTTRTENLAADIAADDADLKAATEVREKESADFAAEEQELVETVDMIKRAIAVLEREMRGGASMLQLKNAGGLAQALSVMLQASLIDTSDATKLTAFIQATQGADDTADDEAFGAPAAAAYESKSGGIVDTLEDLLEKAESQLDETRKKETKAKHDYEMLKQSLEDEMKFATKDMDEAKKGIAAASEKLSVAEGELTVTKKELAADVEAKGELHHDCMSRAQSFESETKSRGEELEVLAKAKQIITESVEGASLSQVSFVQVSSRLSSSMDLKSLEVVRLVRDLGHKERSSDLVQLAAKMASAMRNAGGADPFAKVRSLISDMITKLEGAAEADATKKAYCDKELSETKAKKEEKTDAVQELSTEAEQATAESAKLKEEVAVLQKELSELTKSQAEMDKLRAEEREVFEASRDKAEKGLAGVQMAIKVLKEYYAKDAAHDASTGAASGIIGLLEDIESKMTTYLADCKSDEETAVAEHDTMTKENDIDKTTKEKDVEYKTKEAKELDKSIAELSSDRDGTQEELDAVLEYLSKIEQECIAKPESYEERKKRREAELAGLKEALEVLESETTALVQRRRAVHRKLRGTAVQRAIATSA